MHGRLKRVKREFKFLMFEKINIFNCLIDDEIGCINFLILIFFMSSLPDATI